MRSGGFGRRCLFEIIWAAKIERFFLFSFFPKYKSDVLFLNLLEPIQRVLWKLTICALKFFRVIFKPYLPPHRSHCFSLISTSYLMLSRNTIPVYSENHKKFITIVWENVACCNVKAVGACRLSSTYAVVMSWKVLRKSNFVQVGNEGKCGHLCGYIQASPVEIQTPTHWNLTGHSKTASLPVVSPNSNLPLPSPLCFHCVKEKFVAILKNGIIWDFLT
jgi:hypothetical protein